VSINGVGAIPLGRLRAALQPKEVGDDALSTGEKKIKEKQRRGKSVGAKWKGRPWKKKRAPSAFKLSSESADGPDPTGRGEGGYSLPLQRETT